MDKMTRRRLLLGKGTRYLFKNGTGTAGIEILRIQGGLKITAGSILITPKGGDYDTAGESYFVLSQDKIKGFEKICFSARATATGVSGQYYGDLKLGKAAGTSSYSSQMVYGYTVSDGRYGYRTVEFTLPELSSGSELYCSMAVYDTSMNLEISDIWLE